MPRVSTSATKTTRTTKASTAKAKAPVKKAAAKKAPAKKAPAKTKKVKQVAKLDIKPYKYVLSKTQLAEELADRTGQDRKAAKAFLEQLEQLMQASLMPRGAGEFRFPGVLTVRTRKIKARKGGEVKVNRFTGKDYVTTAKPATVRVRCVAGSKLKVAALQ